MSALIFFAVIYGIYSLYAFLNEDAIDWIKKGRQMIK